MRGVMKQISILWFLCMSIGMLVIGCSQATSSDDEYSSRETLVEKNDSLNIYMNVDTIFLYDTLDRIVAPSADTEYYEVRQKVFVDTLRIKKNYYQSANDFHAKGKELKEYPYYAYVNPFWSYEKWKPEEINYSKMIDTAHSSWHKYTEFPSTESVTCSYLSQGKLVEEDQNYCYYFELAPNEQYVFSMEAIEGMEPPVLRIFKGSLSVVVEAVEFKERWYFPLSSDVLDSNASGASVKLYNKDFSEYSIPRFNIFLQESGYPYPQSFSANLIVAGKYMGTKDSVSVELLAKRILDRLNQALNPGGIKVRVMNVLYAKDHPKVGYLFPESEKVRLVRVGEGEHDSINTLGRWPGHEGEINFVLGYYILDEICTTLGFSPISGSIYTGGFRGAHISLATHSRTGENIITSKHIADVAAHELGHFFGLRHTSENTKISNDQADNLDDTPYCENIAQSDYKDWHCPDYGYIMFPFNYEDYTYISYSPQQMKIIQQYLASTPHK